jgi:hypothetical protein
MRKHLRDADRFRGLTLGEKVRVGCWLGVKMLADGLTAAAAVVAKLRS